MSEQDGTQVTTHQRPLNDDKVTWKAYWKALGQPWRTEPEIDTARQKYLAERRNITPDIKKGSYPFKNIKLSRADIEWLLATHQGGQGPVLWDEEKDKPENERRTGLDLRGADLSLENLSDLPLARVVCWITLKEWETIKNDPSSITPVLMKQVNLFNAQLEGADLRAAHLEGAYLHDAHLEGAYLSKGCASRGG
jgi:hypothetical protein